MSDGWWAFKMGPVLALALAEVLVDRVPPAEAATLVGLVAGSGFALGAFGYVVNDAADGAADAAAGKRNVVAEWSVGRRVAVAGGLLAGAFGVWALRPPSAEALGLLALNALALVLYALPPVRLKERGLAGVAADAAYAHVLPTAFVLAVFDSGAHPPGWAAAWAAALMVWAAAFGARGILLHQLWDRDNDRRAGVETLATRLGPAAVRRAGRWAFGGEAIAAVAVVAVLGLRQPGVALAFALLAALTALARWRRWGRVARGLDPMPIRPELPSPLTLSVVVWPGLVVGGALVTRDLAYLPLLAGYVVLFAGPIEHVLLEWAVGLPPGLRRPGGRLRRWVRGGHRDA